jgi:hypothetical protein
LTSVERLKQAVFYIDESIHSHALVDAMLAAGANLKRVGVDVDFGSPDEAWLQLVGEHGWIALTRDQKIRKRRMELEVLKAYGAAVFCFTGGSATADETAQTICRLLPKFANMAVSEPRPFLYTFRGSGSLSRVVL